MSTDWMKDDARRLLTVADVCALLSISRWTIYDWTKSGVLRRVRLPGVRALRYRLGDVLKLQIVEKAG